MVMEKQRDSVMRRGACIASILGLIIGGAIFDLAGCLVNTPINCENALVNCPTTGMTSSGTGGGGGGGGGMPVGCVPSESAQPVGDDCGVFVSSSLGADSNAGTKSTPMKTLQEAIDKANGRPIYACAEELAGSVTLATGVTIYGGLDCTKGWGYVGATTKSALMGEADAAALTIASTASGAKIEDFTITAASAKAAGVSSIAVVVDGATASLMRCHLVSGDGVPGADGDDAPSTPAQAGSNGNAGAGACSANTVSGAAQVENNCGMESSIGGKGGDGNKSNGTDGSVGLPVNIGGQAGKGDDGSAGWSCNINGGNGQPGAPGLPGLEGAGASMSDLGTLASSGFTGAAGGDGEPGKVGQGGGGGGGVRGQASNECNGQLGIGGASGGSGGAGGCGGAGGKGGKGGGTSIALVSLKASLTLKEVTLRTGNGGSGGAGGDRQVGGDPGADGAGGIKVAGLQAGCDGGKGGPGGDGGAGGGGRGGHAIGLAYTGTAPAIDMKQITVGTAGKGGLGGSNNVKNNQGADGVAAPMQEFP